MKTKSLKIIITFVILFCSICCLRVEAKAEEVSKYELKLGERIGVGEKIYSNNKMYYLKLQADGNLGVFRTSDGVAIWAALSKSQPISNGYYAILQVDGNFAIKSQSNGVVWYTSNNYVGITNQNGVGNVLKVLDNGSLAVLSGNSVLWESNSVDNTINLTDRISVNQKIYSDNKMYYLKLQADGNIGVFRTSDGGAIWGALSKSQPISNGYYAILQADGNFAIKSQSNGVVWYTSNNYVGITNQNGVGNVVKVLDNGSLAVLSGNSVLWESNSVDNTINLTDRISVNQKIYSDNKMYYLKLQADGNLGVFRTSDGGAIWGALSKSQPISNGYYAILQADGNFAIKSQSNGVVWYTSNNYVGITNQNGVGNVVKVLDDGSLVVLSGNTVLWKSNATVDNKSVLRTNLVSYSKNFLGNPYVYGGTDLYKGIDCSGFIMRIYEKYGYKLPRSSSEQYRYSEKILLSQLQPGDLVFYSTNGIVRHVAMYIGNGNVIHAANEKYDICITGINWDSIPYGYGRIIK